MPAQHEPIKRGRPKTLQRDQVLQTAMMSYWADGPLGVTINEICQRANVSKPSLYREFGSDDGLKDAVLDTYYAMVMAPLYDILRRDEPYQQVLDALIDFTVQDRDSLGLPAGCLYAAMRAHRMDLGAITRQKLDLLRTKSLGVYKDWISRAKDSGQFKADISTDIAALYFDTQNVSAMRMQKEGVANDTIREILRLAFSALR